MIGWTDWLLRIRWRYDEMRLRPTTPLCLRWSRHAFVAIRYSHAFAPPLSRSSPSRCHPRRRLSWVISSASWSEAEHAVAVSGDRTPMGLQIRSESFVAGGRHRQESRSLVSRVFDNSVLPSVTNDNFPDGSALEVVREGCLSVVEGKNSVDHRMQRMGVDHADERLEIRARADADAS